MFIVVPYHADTDTREFPWGTVGIIAVNLLVTLVGGFPMDGPPTFIDSWVLMFGTINPLTWITASFVHFDWFHLIFNMLFLWAFGFVVEGYLGWRRFLVLYLALSAANGACTQILMIGADGGGAAGASGEIYGLLAIAALWAPRNTLKVFVWILFYIRRAAEITVLKFCMIYIGLELLAAFLSGFRMSSAVLHLIGVATGTGAGVLMLRKGWVDTEGWDYLSLRKHGRPRREVVVEPPVPPSVRTLVAVRNALENEDPLRADAALRAAPAGFQLPLEDRQALTRALLAIERTKAAIPHMEAWLEQEPRPRVRLRLVQALLEHGQPSRALEHLALLDDGELDDRHRQLKRELEQRANERRGDGRLELE
ncbi:MAG: rhomboid family intramembrane serine protease [Planctomycetota bacterium]|jgi:membrane associated rhomboid family serine protease